MISTKTLLFKGVICCATLSVGTATMADTIPDAASKQLRIPRAMKQWQRPPRKLTLFNNLCRSTLSVDEAHNGLRTSGGEVIPFTGRGVVVGVVDCGIDPRHVAFKNPCTGDSRIALYITTTSALENTKNEFRYRAFRPLEGEHIPKVYIDFEGSGHGTHTTGTAAGSKCGNDYYGMAPDATLVLTSMGNSLYEDEIMFGINSALDYAKDHDMPCVVSLSLGGTAGPHDGTGPISDMIAQELDDFGQIICFAAGNNGLDKCSITHDFTTNPAPVATVMHRGAYNTQAPAMEAFITGEMPDIKIAFSLIRLIDSRNATEEWRSDFVNLSDMAAEAPDILGNYDMIASRMKTDTSKLQILPVTCADGNTGALVSGIFNWDNSDGTYTLGLIVKSESGGVLRIFSEPSSSSMRSFGIPGYIDGNADESISDHCTSPHVISVGAINARESFTDIDGNENRLPDNYGTVPGTALYTSRGTFPEKLPHTMAPGTDVISALIEATAHPIVSMVTDQEGTVWNYGADSGTSMSTPAIAGMIALWLQADPTLSRQDILDLLARFGNTECGGDISQYGVPSAYEGLKYILEQNSLQIVPGIVGGNSTSAPRNLMIKYLDNEQIEFVIPFATTGGEYFLYGIDGTMIMNGNFESNTKQLNLHGLKGVYMLIAVTPQGSASQKIYN